MLDEKTAIDAARSGDEKAFTGLIAPYRRELRAHCYRMSGSLHDADDLVQDSLLRAWKGLAGFEGRSSLRTWLYKVTTSACLDALERRGPRALPMDLAPPSDGRSPIGPPRMDPVWIEPCPEELYDGPGSPEARYGLRESVALAFLVALQVLPPTQRAALILRDVLGWQASECAELLGTTVAAINSALQRARDTMASRNVKSLAHKDTSAQTAALLARYVEAWERADVTVLVALLREDATLAMPPLSDWLRGAPMIAGAIEAMVFAVAGPGAFQLVPTEANGQPAFAAWQRDASGQMQPYAIHVLEIVDDRIASIVAFLDPRLPAHFAAR